MPLPGSNSKFEIFLKVFNLKMNVEKFQHNGVTVRVKDEYVDVNVNIRALLTDGK